MSKAKDRARAESGTIFRDGKLVNKEEWYAAHPTRGMRIEQQAGVDKAVAEVMEAKKQVDEAHSRRIVVVAEHETELAAPQGKTYFCTKCLRYHKDAKSKIYQAHTAHEDHNVPTK